MNGRHKGGNDIGRENNQLRRGSNSSVSDRDNNGRGGIKRVVRHQTGGRRNQWDRNNKRRLESHTNANSYVVNRTEGKLKFLICLSTNYCGHFAEVYVSCTFIDKYNFAHALFLSEYKGCDAKNT